MDQQVAELPLETAGAQLRRAREALGLSRSDIAARTKIAERHLGSIEDGAYNKLASRTYAVGFSRAYARALGLDERAITDAVRNELAEMDDGEDRRHVPSYEPGDPARVPNARLAWLAALAGLALLALGVAFAWRSYFFPAASLPDAAGEPEASASPLPAAPAPAPAAGGQVVFTALEPGVWVKFYDAAGVQLMQKQMAQGESYTVPAGANGPMIWTARPDALQVTVNGRPVAKLADRQTTMKDIPVSAAALLARGAPAVAPASGPAPVASTAQRPVASASAVTGASPAPSAPAAAAATPAPVAPPSQAPEASTVSE